MASAPKTLQQAIQHFSDYANCHAAMVAVRWPDGIVKCPTCGSDKVTYLANAKVWKCYGQHRRPKFSLKVGTVFEDSPLPLQKWLPALWLLTNCKNGISSYELARALGVTQKSAWFMLQRLRLALQDAPGRKLGGDVEVDESYIGGRARYMHDTKKKRLQMKRGRAAGSKTVVMAVLERNSSPYNQHSQVRAKVMPNARRHHLMPFVKDNVMPATNLHTDSLRSYCGADQDFVHNVIDHAKQYVDGDVHTNGCENFWSLLKRAIRGTYVSVEPFHLFRYLDEQVFRFNNRKDVDGGRFMLGLSQIVNKRLTYKALIGSELPQTC
jgi:transposase-like protein